MIKGAYAFLVMTEDKMFVANDPRGLRPLSLGHLGDAWVVSSETCAFDVIGAQYDREVKPGELLIISDEGVETKRFSAPIQRTLCSMEYVYFSRPTVIWTVKTSMHHGNEWGKPWRRKHPSKRMS